MTNEEILAAAQKNKWRGKEYEDKLLARGDTLSALITLLLGLALFMTKYFITGTLDAGLISVGTCASGVEYLYEGMKLKKWYFTVAGVFLLIICIIAIIVFIGKLVAA